MHPMKIVRFKHGGKVFSGILEADDIRPIENSVYDETILAGKSRLGIKDVKLLPPAEPSKIVCVGLNYKEHAGELGMPVPEEPTIFLKPSTAVIGTKEDIVYPPMVTRLDYEAELAVVIKKQAKGVSVKDAPDYILGYTCMNDVTARNLQKKDVQWTRAKSFDTFAPVGPCVATGIDPAELSIRLFVNGTLCQSSPIADQIFDVYFLVWFISHIMTLLPGDIIATGTPKGIGPLNRGDSVAVDIDHIGRLENGVI